ncbi:Maf family protein [Cellvibrio polysaccharolyticus]|uniref:dTTP/UTP pyrophosphatase n=1 Tax=Cellvibrio polysaccharolyticus TaxID=2082724 RepID=A0A928YV97_9GAMM|nr:Maf family nucleotide pyrophosphatase [Cellvibrio polysaccharolyticus]MBE8716833.1 septum formation inhibitor Maf [Cellvibrio polysaccharolyticus]
MSVAVQPDLYLASQSPRRSQLLAQIGVRHQVISVDVPEQPEAGESAAAYVERLALSKARAGFSRVQEESLAVCPVMGADTIVVCDGDILEKPRNQQHGAAMLANLSGRVHQVFTAVALCAPGQQQVERNITEVRFRILSNEEITTYWLTGEPRDKAGGYAIQGLGAVFVEEIRGSYTNVVGLPLETTRQLLQAFRVPWWQTNH